MRQLLLSAVAVLVLGGVGEAGENQLAQPYSPPQQVITPPTIIFPGNPTSLAQLEEEVETLEAHRDTKKAFVKAAEVGVRAAELNLQRMQTVVSRGAASKEEVDRAGIDVEAAKAQVEIRMAEMKEVEVKIKYAKKRLEDAKSGPRPLIPQPVPNPPKLIEPPKFGPQPKPIEPPKLADPPKIPDPPKLEVKPVDPKRLLSFGDDMRHPALTNDRMYRETMPMGEDREKLVAQILKNKIIIEKLTKDVLTVKEDLVHEVLEADKRKTELDANNVEAKGTALQEAVVKAEGKVKQAIEQVRKVMWKLNATKLSTAIMEHYLEEK
jgi:hypothetical protein